MEREHQKIIQRMAPEKKILLPPARHLEERLSQSGKQAGRQACRNTQFGFFSVADHIYKQSGVLIEDELAAVEW